MSARIYSSVEEYRLLKPHTRIVVTSGGFDPLTRGHIRCFQESAWRHCSNWQEFVVIVNGDGFLQRKKGYIFMPLEERIEIIAALECVDAVVPFDDGTQYVSEALEILRPEVFTKGGDRSSPENVPEYEICKKIGCSVVFGVGGYDKIQSSSELVNKVRNIQLS